MIRYLAIRNLAVIESVAVEFERSFNILTGETGAGKSILVEAVGLLLGGRASQDLVRTGEDLAVVEALFETSDGRECSVRREITSQGRSRAFVDGALATASVLKALASELVELHGQHEHQQLLDPSQHLSLLDDWAGLTPARQAVSDAFAQVRSLREALDRLRMDSRERASRLDLLEFQMGELQRAALQPGEDDALAAERQLLRGADTIRRLCGEAYADLYDTESAALSTLGRVWKRVAELSAIDPTFAPYLDAKDDVKAQLEDLAFALRDAADRIDLTPGRLQQVEDRLALLERLKRRYGPALEDVLRHQDEVMAEHAALSGGASTAAAVEQDLGDASERFLGAARALSSARQEAARRFAPALEAELAGLAMERTCFEVRLTTRPDPADWTEAGLDTGEFFLSPNVGEDLRPLARIVSGGELSRVMLALKTLAMNRAGEGVTGGAVKTVIFEEVDAGIGGRVATVVGQKLAALGARYQVLCITHLPQIAAFGHTHYLIDKRVQRGRTVTSVARLGVDQRPAELARMMGGLSAGERALASAEELLASARAKGEIKAKAKGESPRMAKAKAGAGRERE